MEYDEIKKREVILKKVLSEFDLKSEERKKALERIESLSKIKTKMEGSYLAK